MAWAIAEDSLFPGRVHVFNLGEYDFLEERNTHGKDTIVCTEKFPITDALLQNTNRVVVIHHRTRGIGSRLRECVWCGRLVGFELRILKEGL